MNKPRFLSLAIFSLISLSVFSQNLVTTTPTDWFNCTGTATLNATNVDTLSIVWQEIAALPSIFPAAETSAINLCEGSYMVTFNLNGVVTTEYFTITTPFCIMTATISGSNPLDLATCNGSAAVVPTNGTPPYTYVWYGDANGETTSNINNLCPGYYCCQIIDANYCATDNLCIDLMSPTPNGDTLIINGGSSCLPALTSLEVVIEDCLLDYNAVDTAYITNIILPSNPLDSTLCTWNVVDTNGIIYNYSVYYTYMNSACYELQLQLYCYLKSSNVKTLILSQGMYLGYAGMNAPLENEKQLLRVVDLLGRETTIESNKLLFYIYSDGSIEKVFIAE
jgi:hypothetical protein